jgi:hypothetical protein
MIPHSPVDDDLLRLRLNIIEVGLASFKRRCFNLELEVKRLDRYPRKTKEEKREFRMRRAELRHQAVMLRIDVEHAYKKAKPILSS